MYDKFLRWLISPFPPDSVFRKVGKRFCRQLSIKQKFYNGVIYFDGVGQSWAFKGTPYDTIDTKLRNELLSLSKGCQYFIDIGCNIGSMTLSVLLRNENIDAVCLDPNTRTLGLLKKSLRANRLGHRATIRQMVVGNENGYVHFASDISEWGHVSQSGKRVECIRFVDLINQYSSKKCLVKIDVEGYETILLRSVGDIKNLHNVCFVIELHPLGYNEGNPEESLNLLQRSGAILRQLEKENNTIQVIARWNS